MHTKPQFLLLNKLHVKQKPPPLTNLYRSYPAALAEPLVGVVAFSESFANLRTGRSSAGAVFAFFDGDMSVESVKIGMLAGFGLSREKCDVIRKRKLSFDTEEPTGFTDKRCAFGALCTFPAFERCLTSASHKICNVMKGRGGRGRELSPVLQRAPKLKSIF